jgi:hypothetical protein
VSASRAVTAVAAMYSRASDGLAAIACAVAADRPATSASRPPIAARRLSAALTRSAVTAASASSFLAACTAVIRSARRASPNRISASKTKTNMAHTAAAVMDWLGSSTTMPDHRAASSAARTAVTNHDAGDGIVSKTSPASHPDGAQFAPNQANGR